MSRLFKRECTVAFGPNGSNDGRSYTGLRVAFEIEKTITSEPNGGTVRIFNLSKETREYIDNIGDEDPIFTLQPKYEGGDSFIMFVGDIDYVTHTKDGADWVTQLECGDGRRASRYTISRSYSAKTAWEAIMQDAADEFEKQGGTVGEIKGMWSLAQANYTAAQADKSDKSSRVAKATRAAKKAFSDYGVVLYGNLMRQMEKHGEAYGVTPTVNNGVLEMYVYGAVADTAKTTCALLTPSTGLIGSPRVLENGGIGLTALIQPELFPGHPVRVAETDLVPDSYFQIVKAKFTGDTHSDPWYAEIEAVAI